LLLYEFTQGTYSFSIVPQRNNLKIRIQNALKLWLMRPELNYDWNWIEISSTDKRTKKFWPLLFWLVKFQSFNLQSNSSMRNLIPILQRCNAWSTMAVSVMDEAVRVRNWSITVDYSSHFQLWLINLLLLQPHPLLPL